MAIDTAAGEAVTYLTFRMAGETYALDVRHVSEVIRYERVTVVPSAPPHVRGVMNLRGGAVPVVDLACRFGLPPAEPSRWTCVVMAEVPAGGGTTLAVGLMVDAVQHVVEIADGSLEPAPSFGTRIHVDYLRGMAPAGAGFHLVLDAERMLDADELLAAVAPSSAAAEPGA
jgi:purine-binding chemotaxis protein CheW